jgi:hypothetical protein
MAPCRRERRRGQRKTKATLFLPLPEISRKPASAVRDPSPKPAISTRRRRQDPSWRGFSVRLYAEPGVDGIRSFRALLKVALRRFGLRAVDAREIHEDENRGR